MSQKIKDIIAASIAVKQEFLNNERLVSELTKIAESMVA